DKTPEGAYAQYIGKESGRCLDIPGGYKGWVNFQIWDCNHTDRKEDSPQQLFKAAAVESSPLPTDTTMTVGPLLGGAPGYMSFHGYVKAGYYSMVNRVVHGELEKLEGGNWNKQKDFALPVNSEGYYEYNEEAVGQGQWRIRGLFVGNSEFGGSASGEHYFTI